MIDIINEIMDFFLSVLVDKSIQEVNKSNLKKIVVFLIIVIVGIFSLGLFGGWLYTIGEYFIAVFVWGLMIIFIIMAFKIYHKLWRKGFIGVISYSKFSRKINDSCNSNIKKESESNGSDRRNIAGWDTL